MFEQVRDKLGWQVKLLHDVHEHLTPTLALEFARRMQPHSHVLCGRHPSTRAN